jgi:hypothetical protein
MACSFVFGAPRQLGVLEGLEHGRTIPFSDIRSGKRLRRARSELHCFWYPSEGPNAEEIKKAVTAEGENPQGAAD